MASISGTFVADGVSAELTGVVGNVDISVKTKKSTGNVTVQVSYDAGTSWDTMEGGKLGNNSVDRVLISGSTSIRYRLQAKGVNGSIRYYMGSV
jgi:hypothetical protein